MRLKHSRSVFSACTLLSASLAAAAPDAGSVQQEILRDREPAARPVVRGSKPVVPERPLSGSRFTVREFVFEGNTLITGEQLSVALASCLNKEVDFERLRACAALVTEKYQSLGWVAKAVLPPQDIKDGTVAIKVIEARFGSYVFTGKPASRVSRAQLQQLLDVHQTPGELLNMGRIDRGLLLADDLPGVGVSASLVQGAQDSSTNVVIELADEPLVAGNGSLDNFGSLSTGSSRFNASLNLNSPLKIGDLFSLSAMASAGNRYQRMEETWPLGHQGFRVGLNASYLTYKLTQSEYAALDAKGAASTLGVSASFPLIRAREKNLNLSAAVDRKAYSNSSGGLLVSDYLIKTMTLGLDGSIFDEILGGGANAGSLIGTAGDKDLSGSPNQLSDALSANTQGQFKKIRYQLSRQQKIDADWSLFLNHSGQISGRNLDSSESFYLGGTAGVRAYPSNEGRGSEGQLLNLELRKRLPSGWSWIGFYDWGRVLGYPQNNFAGASSQNVTVLKGYGMSVTWQTGRGSTLKATWARRIGSNPGATPAGKDQDGTLVRNRLWLSASLPF